jgi:hypothetical protein
LDPTKSAPSPQGTPQLLQELERLAPALEGYPVNQLLGFLSGEQRDLASRRRLVDRCLGTWIESLDHAIDTLPGELDDSMRRVKARERKARDALAHLKSALPSAEVVRQNGGQPC